MTEENKDVPKVIMLPPVLVLLHIAAGITLNWAIPMSFGHAWGWPGLVLLGLGLGVAAWSRKLFEKAGTNVPPNQPTLVIVKSGPYRFSRNPIYLGFLMGFAGLSFLANAPMMFLMIFPLFYVLERHVVVPEEEYLAEKFGETYLQYKAQVRRWL